MATQKIDVDNFQEFIDGNINRLQKINELIWMLENEYSLLEENNSWQGKNADAFYDALDTLCSNNLVSTVEDEVKNINDYLDTVLLKAIETDQEVSSSIEVTKNE